MKCPRCGAKALKVGVSNYDCTKGCGVYLIQKLSTYESKFNRIGGDNVQPITDYVRENGQEPCR